MPTAYEYIYDAVKRIPPGRVATYGQIAAIIGSPRAARVVGHAMRLCSDPAVPCRRVVKKDGALSECFGSFGAREQEMLLCAEGVTFLPDGRVDMARCGWRPEEK